MSTIRSDAERASDKPIKERSRRQRDDPANKRCQHAIEELHSKLRSQASDLEHVEAIYAEQQARIRYLQAELAHLKRAQRINIKDLAHVSARLVALAQANRLPLDAGTIEILRRRGWISQKRRAEARHP